MSTPGPDDPTAPSQPSAELGGLDPKDLLNAGLETVPPVTLPPQLVDSDATIAVSRPQSTQPRNDAPELPLPEELTNLLPHGNYSVESFLGQGGMGAVYKGMQVRLKRPVAIKIMRRDLGKDHDFEARFEREAQAMAKLNHPNIVSVIDYGEAGPDYLYIVMELVDGADLMDVIRGGQMTQEMALSLLPQICDALQFAHDHGIVHRDIKPSNIMLTRDGRIKMADFGLAKRFDVESSFRTQTGTGMGTPDYAAPEQFSPNSPIDHRADIYALGVMIYQMITGHLPRGVWKPPSQRAKVSTQWDAVVSRAMQSDPSDRYQQASEVKTDVSSIPLVGAGRAAGPSAAAGSPTTANHPSAALGGPSAPPQSRAPLFIGLITGAVVIALGAFFVLRDAGDGRAAGPPAAASGSTSSNPQKAPATSNAALAGASALPKAATPAPITATALPKSGWKPLVSQSEWQKSEPGKRQFKDGLLHVTNWGLRAPQTSVDGAVRATVRVDEGVIGPAVQGRHLPDGRLYSWQFDSDMKTLLLKRAMPGMPSTVLAKGSLPQPLRAGDSVVIELRIVGPRLIGLVNAQVLAEAEDDQNPESGNWGIYAESAWFESAEFQPLPAAASPLWTDALAAWWQGGTQREGWVREKDGSARLTVSGPIGIHLGKIGATTPPIFSDQAVRARFRLGNSPHLTLGVCRSLQAEGQARGYYAAFAAGKSSITLTLDSPGMASHAELAAVPLPRGLDRAATHTMELRNANHLLTLILDGQTLYEKPHTQHTQGYPVLQARQGAIVESLEVADLGGGAVSPAPNLPVSASWQNALADSAQLKFFNKAEITPDGFLLTGMSSGITVYAGQERADGALRLRATADGLRLGMRARIDKQGSHYKLDIPHQTTLKLQRWDNVARQSTVLREFPLPPGFNLSVEHEIELRAEGSTLTVSLDRQMLGTATDAVLKSGTFGVSVGEPMTKPVLIKTLEVLDSGNAAVSPAPNLPVTKSSDPKFPPGQWVKLFTKPEDLPASLRKPDSGVTWEDGWIKGDGRKLLQMITAASNVGVRARVMRKVIGGDAKGGGVSGITLRSDSSQRYQLKLLDDRMLGLRFVGQQATGTTVLESPLPSPLLAGQEITLEFATVGNRLIARAGNSVLKLVSGAYATSGSVFISGTDDLRDIEVINLDGLPEAEALRLLGVDEQGKDLRGKTGAAEAWIDVLRDPSIVTLSQGAEFTPEGLRLPGGSGAYVYRGKSLRSDVALRVRTTFGGARLQLRSRSDGRGFYSLTVVDDKSVAIQRFDSSANKGILLRAFTLTSPLKPGEDYEMEFRCVGPALTASVNGEVLGTITDETHTEGSCTLAAWETSQTTALAKAFYVLDLSKASASAVSPAIHSFNGHRYQLSSTPCTWEEAKAKAEAMGGHLATFTTESEERWARETILQPLSAQESASTKAPDNLYWIGGHAAAQSKDFRWLSGEPLGKIGWRNGNPGWRERADMPETKAVGALFAAGLVVERPRANGEWISVQQQSLLRSGFIIEWDDAGGTSSVSPAPNLPVPARNASRSDAGGSKSSDPKFPPGQWVKVFTKAEDLPEELRKPDSGVKWEDGWIRWSEQSPSTILRLSQSMFRSCAVKAVVHRDPGSSSGSIVLRSSRDQNDRTVFYNLVVTQRDVVEMKRTQDDSLLVLSQKQVPQSVLDSREVAIEFGAVGDQFLGRLNNSLFLLAKDDTVKEGWAHINKATSSSFFIRDIEVINLDGLPEAEALRLLGVDEQGKDLRGTGRAASPKPPSDGALGQSALPGAATKATPLEPGAIRLWDAPEKLTSTPKGISWKDDALHIHSSVMAVRVDNKPLTHRDSIVRFSLRMNRDAQWANVIVRDAGTPAAPRQYKLSINPPTGVIKFIVADGGTERLLLSKPLPRPYAPEEWLRVELRSVGDDFTVSLDGQPLETVHDTTLPNRGLTHFGATANACFRDIVYVPLDKPAGVSSSPNLPVTKSSAATATKAAPFINSLGMKFVPVPGTQVLFSIWPTRVQDYEVFVKEAKLEWGKAPFEQGPTHPVVGPNWDDAQAFGDWLTETERKAGKLGANERYRLPSDHEWSCAVDLGDKEDASQQPAEKHLKIADVFPWGKQWPPPKGAGNFAGEEMQAAMAAGKFSNIKGEMPGYHDGFVDTAPVGSFAANRFGLHDMGGNVWQWCADWVDGSQKARVLRGSSSQDRDRMFLQSSFRNRYQPQAHMINHGFRCVLEAK